MTPRRAARSEVSPSEDDAPLALDRFLPYRLSVLTNTISQTLARAYHRRFGLSVAEWRVMAVLAEAAPLSAVDVCARTAMDKVRVSRAVRGLEDAGLLTRRPDPGDRRRHFLTLTALGTHVYARIVPLARATEARLMEPLDAGERASLDRLLAKLQRRADALARRR